jgi:HPt (histidine-containing phosphotransfer) domain-containing protein
MKIYNRDELLANFSGDEEILRDLIEEFVKKSNALILDIEMALKSQDGNLLKLHAHTLKGVVSNFYSEEIRLLAYDLEQFGAQNNFKNAESKLAQLKSKMQELIRELNILQKTL